MNKPRAPKPADVARWVSLATSKIDRARYGGACLREIRERDNARARLDSHGLDATGNPKPARVPS